MLFSRRWAALATGLALTGGIVSSTGNAQAQKLGLSRERSAIEADWEVARTHIAKRDFHGAMNACGLLKKRTGGAAASHVCAAEAHLLWRRGTEARAELAEAVKHSPTPDVAYFARLAEGRVEELASKDSEAASAYRAAMTLAPNRSEAPTLLGALLHRSGDDGVPELKKAVELDAHDATAQFELGRALLEKGKRADAIAALEKATAERAAYVDALRVLTDAYLAEGRIADAKKTAATLTKAAPNDAFGHVATAKVALAENRPDDAIAEGQAALKLMPHEPKAKLVVADAYVKKGEIDLALEAYQQAMGLDPEDPTPLVRAAAACLAANRVTSAKAFGKRAVTDFPQHAASWVANGDALAADGNGKEARSSYEAARRAKGADPRAIDGKLSGLK